MGLFLKNAIGERYFVIGTSTLQGAFTTWIPGPRVAPGANGTVPVAQPGAYETYFQRGGAPYLLVPLRGSIPDWLRGPARFFTAPANATTSMTIMPSLPEKLDAVLYVETTTPLHYLGQ